ncbi:MAG: Gfo/Idh/MocA family oxidoreductase [Burkholderiales bacterium]|nr:Gfo/Idh/MocA family oxidoreductase [Phycisphaerae bacterium]
MNPAEFVIIGGGWRAQFFLRGARDNPALFRVSGMMVRDAAKGRQFELAWGVKTFRTIDQLLAATSPLFAVVSVPRSVVVDLLEDLTNRNIPVLTETPPGSDVASLDRVNALTPRGGRIQVAEQYIFQPMHAARLAVVRSGVLGTPSQAQVSFTQGYHGISLIRHYLGIKAEPVRITARRFESPIYKGPDRSGPPKEEKLITCAQTIAWLEWPGKLGVFDFANDQHRSYVRSDRVLVRGEKGEINQSRVRHLGDFKTPITFDLLRHDAGIDTNLEGYHHRGIVGGGRWWYENPFVGDRLADDEIAVATCLSKMADYARGGDDFYSLAEASHDHYLSLMMEQSAVSQTPVDVPTMAWAKW